MQNCVEYCFTLLKLHSGRFARDVQQQKKGGASKAEAAEKEEGHRSPKVLGKYYSYSTGVFAHGYLRASTSETHAQVSETARTGAAAGHSGESGRERRHAPLRGLSPCGDHTPSSPLYATRMPTGHTLVVV